MKDLLLEWMGGCDPRSWRLSAQIAAAFIATMIVACRIKSFNKSRNVRKLKNNWNSIPKDTVILHQFWRGKYCPNLSPFALKIETMMRLAGIKYIVDTEVPFGLSRKKCPWITLNGTDTEDSEYIKERLEDHFNTQLQEMDGDLTDLEKANLEALRILADEHLFWCIITWRYYHDKCKTFMTTQTFSWYMSKLFPLFMPIAMKRKSSEQGIGRYSYEEVFNFFKKDCHTLSVVLGDKDYFGGTKPSSADCSIFGQLAQIMWNAPDTHYQNVLTGLYPNLGAYCLRMKVKAFPDWNNLLNPPVKD